MNEVIDVLGFTETIPAAGAVPDFLAACPDSFQWVAPVQRRADVRVSGGWTSTLCQRDLQCLLQVIETDLIPRLLGGYSPAAFAPLLSQESLG